MVAPPLEIRHMSEAELGLALDWAAGEGWNPGLHDAACFYATDPEGFLIGVLDGEPVASIFAVRYGASFGFIGGYIVKPAWRGRGYGWALWQAAMQRLSGRNIGLDGVLAQQANYAKSGFHLAHRNFRYEGRGGGHSADAHATVPLSALSDVEICRYDRRYFPEERARFLQRWVRQEQHIALGVAGTEGLTGYVVARPCRTGYKVGPLFADTPAVAEQLFASVLGKLTPEQPVFLDVPELNPAAVALAERHQMQRCFETARMYTREAPELSMDRQYGITSFELG
ncbi:acyl-CoA N-acyltransferase [Janthinobacterium sp. HH01]|uniref:GNAT family N-acetyltransferase n=1 Tax=Janthinobacterium sp. HH01 TaxID=1198452 RepID=UPI0002AE8E91|nr:GNAT family N-acetyltransferase [Janthinobacterium sp. HH01]ELX12985.1 acyl-CoA N-acyltransferase [Janthinobacterium sp. HH01]